MSRLKPMATVHSMDPVTNLTAATMHTINVLQSWWTDETGVTAIEYGLLASLVAVGALAGFSTLGDALFDQFEAWVAKVLAVLVG